MIVLSVDSQRGQVVVVTLGRVVVPHDCGLIINPDGLKNQIEGNAIQSAGPAMVEQVNFDTSKIPSVDWRTYPIFRFDAAPKIDEVLIDHPDQPAWSPGECASLTMGAATANASVRCQKLRNPLSRMIAASVASPRTAETTVAKTRINVIGLANWRSSRTRPRRR
jgi:CO/xanthine dehydrogenase Mo-binding subunit